MENQSELLISSSPHLKSPDSTSSIMWTVAACLVPAGIWGVYVFGLTSLFVLIASIGAAVLAELVMNALLKKENTLFDGSAFLTGLLIGFNMPPEIPLFIPMLSSVFAIVVVKQTFGGIGRNWMNPALAGRVFALFCWTGEMTTWTNPSTWAPAVSSASIDAATAATPLTIGSAKFLQMGTYWDLFIGNIAGCIGEVSALLLLLGALVLFFKKIITWEIPVAYIGVFALLSWIFGGGETFFSGDVLFHFLSGGLILGAFYMATDMVTSPLTGKGMLIFGAGCGLFTFLIRFYGGFPEGVSLAIILMNILVPTINNITKPVRFGLVKEESK